MGLWLDIQQGKKPFKPKLSWKSVGLRLAFSLPFLVFGGYLIYRTAEARVSLEREESGVVSARVYRQYWVIPFPGRGMNNVEHARVAEEMRVVEKIASGGSSRGRTLFDERSVSKIILEGGPDGLAELPVSEFRFGSDQINQETARELNEFLRAENKHKLTRAIPFEQPQIMPRFAMLFLFAIGGFIFISLPIDVLIWWIQKRYQARRKS